MISTLEIIDKLYMFLNVPEITSVITGKVCKSIRPLNSRKVDIVIGCLPTNNLQLQTAVANVNIHVPNLILKVDNVQDNSQPDIKKLRSLTDIVISKLKETYSGDYWFDVQQQHVFAEENINEHYSNIRVNFYSINI